MSHPSLTIDTVISLTEPRGRRRSRQGAGDAFGGPRCVSGNVLQIFDGACQTCQAWNGNLIAIPSKEIKYCMPYVPYYTFILFHTRHYTILWIYIFS